MDPFDVARLSPDAAIGALRSRSDGLTGEEAAGRLRDEGTNEIPAPHGPGSIRRLIAQLTHFFALLLWVAAVLAYVGGMPQLAIAITVVVVVNGVFSFVQEERAERATAALRDLLPVESTVIRDGRRQRIPASELVRGDLLILREGDRISADARVVMADALRLDQSALTGESVPIGKDPQPIEQTTGDTVRVACLLFAATYVTSGAGTAIVYATGSHTRLGGIATLTRGVERRPTPLREDLDRAVRVIASFAVGAGLVFFGASLALGAPARDGFLFAIGVIVALVPEGLLPTLTLSLALSATRMAKRGALVRSLESVETLGATTVICSDKTGTMTTNQMTARAARTGAHDLRATHAGWTPGGTLLEVDRPLDPRAQEDVRALLEAAALCGDARLEEHDGTWRCVGDPTEGALLAFARKGGLDREVLERALPRVADFPFSSERRRMTTVHRTVQGSVIGYTKGSPETVLAACTSVQVDGDDAPLDDAHRSTIHDQIEELAGAGLRVLGFATRHYDGSAPAGAAAAERDLRFVGLIGMEDPYAWRCPTRSRAAWTRASASS